MKLALSAVDEMLHSTTVSASSSSTATLDITINVAPGIYSGVENVNLQYSNYSFFDNRSATIVGPVATITVLGSGIGSTIFDCGCDFLFGSPCTYHNVTRAFTLNPGGINAISDLHVRNCGSLPAEASEVIPPARGEMKTKDSRPIADSLNVGGAILIDSFPTSLASRQASTTTTTTTISYSKAMNITNILITGSFADRGGALAIRGTANKVYIKNSAFQQNRAQYSGGGLHFETTDAIDVSVEIEGGVSITESDFYNNSVVYDTGHGGALSAYGGNDSPDKGGDDPWSRHAKSWNNRLHVVSTVFRNNSAFMGGAVFSTGVTTIVDPIDTSPEITISDASNTRLVFDYFDQCEFLNNKAIAQGGAQAYKYVYGGVKVSNSLYYQNIAIGISVCPYSDETCGGAGGAITSVYSPLKLYGSVVEGNGAFSTAEFFPRGGAVFAFYDTHGTKDPENPESNLMAIEARDTTFQYNAASAASHALGGAVWVNGGGTMSNCKFYNNTATSSLHFGQDANAGGGLYVQRSGMTEGDSNDGYIVLSKSSFVENSVGPGGYGGGVYARGDSVVQIDDVDFVDNVATSSYSIKSAGGGVSFVSGVMAFVTGTNFTNNKAVPYHDDKDFQYYDFGYATDSKFTMPQPDGKSGEGGAMYLEGSSAIVESTSFTGNYCDSGCTDNGAQGGAVSIVSYNAGPDYTDGYNQNHTQSTFNNVDFSSNVASSSDGPVDDKASGRGGAVHVASASPLFTNCLFYNNRVVAGGSKVSLGGAVNLYYAYTPNDALVHDKNRIPDFQNFIPGPQFHQCRFVENKAQGQQLTPGETANTLSLMQSGRGGAIASTASKPYITNSTFLANSATAKRGSILPSMGGAIFLDYDSQTYVYGTEFKLDQAVFGAGSEIASFATSRYKEGLDETFRYSEYVNNVNVPKLSDDPSDGINDSTQLKLVFCSFEPVISQDHEIQIDDIHSIWSSKSTILAFGGTIQLKEGEFFEGTSIVIAGPGSTKLIGPYVDQIDFGEARLYISGGIKDPIVDLISWNSELNFNSGVINQTFDNSSNWVYSPPAYLKSLKMINGTISSSTGVYIVEDALILGGTLTGQDLFHQRPNASNIIPNGPDNDNEFVIPTLIVLGEVSFGSPDQFIPTPNDVIPSSPIFINNMAVFVEGELLLGGPDIYLNNSATIVVNTEGTLNVQAPTKLYSQELQPADHWCLHNWGSVIHGDLLDQLSIMCSYAQSDDGVLNVMLPSVRYWEGALLDVHGRVDINGTLNVTFEPETVLNNGDKWLLSSFRGAGEGSIQNYDIVTNSPWNIELKTDLIVLENGGYNETIYLKNIECASVLEYGDDSNAPCDICLNAGAGCSWCGAKGCVPKDEIDIFGEGECNVDNCCPSECNQRGTCNAFDKSCECDWFYDSASNCVKWSPTAVLTVTASGAVIIFIGVSIGYLWYLTKKKREVVTNALDELRYGLLNDDIDADNTVNKNEKSQVTSGYIQDIAQQLFLKDVSVNYDEVELGEQIGAGTYGVVYKGIWRGSAVAVKVIRPNVLIGMGEAEIENFKGEAYIMSRLRHPNIVLIMGISMRNVGAMAGLGGLGERSVSQGSGGGLGGGRGRSRSESGNNNSSLFGEENRNSVVDNLYIISEFMDKGSLSDIMKLVREEERMLNERGGLNSRSSSGGHSGTFSSNNGKKKTHNVIGWNYEMVLACAIQAGRGMTYLHSNSPPICHRDLKSSNLVVDEHWVVKVTDFGTSRMLPGGIGNEKLWSSSEGATNNRADNVNSDTQSNNGDKIMLGTTRESTFDTMMTSNVGTTAWVAPEMFTSEARARYSLKVDVYSFGMVLWELWEKKTPFSEFTSRFDIMDAVRGGKRPEISDNCPKGYRDLIQRCVAQKPSDRPNFNTIVKELKTELAHLKEAAALLDAANYRVDNANLRSKSFANNNPSAQLLGALRANSNSTDFGGGGGSPSVGGYIVSALYGRDDSRERRRGLMDSVLSSPILIGGSGGGGGRGGRSVRNEELQSVDEFSSASFVPTTGEGHGGGDRRGGGRAGTSGFQPASF